MRSAVLARPGAVVRDGGRFDRIPSRATVDQVTQSDDDTVSIRWGTHGDSPTHHAVQPGRQTLEPGEATAACGEALDEIGPADDPWDPLRDNACGRCANRLRAD
jgi:hypothetical protein